MTDVDFSQVENLFQKIKAKFSPETVSAFLQEIGERVGTMAESYGIFYPPAAHLPRPKMYSWAKNGNTSAFKSYKQQRKVMAMFAEGTAPYSRSGFLGASLTHSVTVMGASEVDIKLGTNVPYADLVVGKPGEQSPYFAAAGWKSLQDDVNSHEAEYWAETERLMSAYLGDI